MLRSDNGHTVPKLTRSAYAIADGWLVMLMDGNRLFRSLVGVP